MSPQDSHYAQLTEANPGNAGAAATGTARIGGELRQVRERGGWKLADVAAQLRIREPYLDAIEHGDLEALPGPAYQVAFVRAYAQALGLDGEEILRRFRAEGVGAAKKPELSFLAPVPDRAVPSGAIVLVGVVVLLAGYGFWFLHTENDRSLAASVPPVPAQLAPLALPPAPPALKSLAPAEAQASPAIKTPALAGVAASNGAASTATAPPASPAVATPAVATAGKSILATADSWVEVKDASGNILFSRVMHAGDSWPVPDLPGLTMTAGNAGGTEIADSGAASQPLGATGAVLRSYALTAAGPPPANAVALSPAASVASHPNAAAPAAKGAN